MKKQGDAWMFNLDSVGHLSKMIIRVDSDIEQRRCCHTGSFSYNCQSFLNEISKQQLAHMLMILRENRDWFSLLQKYSTNDVACDLYSDILSICLLKVNQHQFHIKRPVEIMNVYRAFLKQPLRFNSMPNRLYKMIREPFSFVWNIMGSDNDIKFPRRRKYRAQKCQPIGCVRPNRR